MCPIYIRRKVLFLLFLTKTVKMLFVTLIYLFILQCSSAYSITPVTPIPSTPTVTKQSTFHVKVGLETPRFQPSRLHANVGDTISFQLRDIDCTLRSSRYACIGAANSSLVTQARRVTVGTANTQFFFCDYTETNMCDPDMIFILNMPSPSKPFGNWQLGRWNSSRTNGNRSITRAPMPTSIISPGPGSSHDLTSASGRISRTPTSIITDTVTSEIGDEQKPTSTPSDGPLTSNGSMQISGYIIIVFPLLIMYILIP